VSRGVRSQAADRDRFEQVYGETRQAVLAYLLRRTDSIEDAADLLSEVYLVAWRRIGNLPLGDEARLLVVRGRSPTTCKPAPTHTDRCRSRGGTRSRRSPFSKRINFQSKGNLFMAC